MDMFKLTLTCYAEKPEDERRVTLSPQLITVVAAQIEDVQVNGRSLRAVSVLFMDGGSVDLLLNHQDLETLETAVGSYGFG
jgi:hypothetical protein